MYSVALIFAITFVFVSAVPGRTKDEWKDGIKQMLASLTDALEANNQTALAELFTPDYELFIPGRLKSEGIDELDETRHNFEFELMDVRWNLGSVAIAEFTISRESEANIQHLEHCLAVIVEESGKLRLSTIMYNFVY